MDLTLIQSHIQKHINDQRGFSLIEMLVSLALFTVVITIAMGSLLSIIGGTSQQQDEQSVISNLSFAMDSMTREIRTGVNYFCEGGDSAALFDSQEGLSDNASQDCTDGLPSETFRGVSFEESGSSITGTSVRRIAYFYDPDRQTILRRVGNQDPAESIVSDQIAVTNAVFYVSGTERLIDGNEKQPSVTVFLEAEEADAGPDAADFQMQTTITQRVLDI